MIQFIVYNVCKIINLYTLEYFYMTVAKLKLDLSGIIGL